MDKRPQRGNRKPKTFKIQLEKIRRKYKNTSKIRGLKSKASTISHVTSLFIRFTRMQTFHRKLKSQL